MYLFCSNCQRYVNAQKFKRFFGKEMKKYKEEFYCVECMCTIYIKESNKEEN